MRSPLTTKTFPRKSLLALAAFTALMSSPMTVAGHLGSAPCYLLTDPAPYSATAPAAAAAAKAPVYFSNERLLIFLSAIVDSLFFSDILSIPFFLSLCATTQIRVRHHTCSSTKARRVQSGFGKRRNARVADEGG